MGKKPEEGTYARMLKQAQKDGTAIRVTPKFVEFKNKDDQVVGRLKGLQTIKSSKNEGTYQHYIVESDDGLIKFALGSATDGEIAPLVRRGGVYAFKFLGQEDLGGGRKVNKFDVVELADGFVPMEIPDGLRSDERKALTGREDIPF